jgi:hypothetical protein
MLNPPNGVCFDCFYSIFFSHVQRLSTLSRPEEVFQWIKAKRTFSPPHIENTSQYGTKWRVWWVKLQPAWRGGELLVKVQPADGMWEKLFLGGSSGLYLVVVALSWWVKLMGTNGQHSLELSVAINDVIWVFSKLVEVLAAKVKTGGKVKAGSKKHTLDEQNEGTSKK